MHGGDHGKAQQQKEVELERTEQKLHLLPAMWESVENSNPAKSTTN